MTGQEIRPGYKQTEVGVIPDDWELRQGTEITRLIGKGASPRWQGFSYTDSGMLFVTSENVRDGFLDLENPKFLPLAFHEKIKRTKLKKGDLLINLVGASIGRSCLVDRELGEANVNQAVSVFRCSEAVLPEFVSQCFQLPATIDRILGMQVEAARPNISLGDLRRFWFTCPPIPEQRAIAAALADADALIAALEGMISKKRDLKQAAMQHLLTGKTRLPGFSGEWERTTVGECIERFFCGPSPTCEERNIDGDQEWGVLKTTAITWENGWDWEKHKVLPRSMWNKPEIEIRRGDVIVTKAGPRHRVGVSAWVDYVPARIVVSGKMIALRPKPSKAVAPMLSSAIAEKGAQEFIDQRTTGMAESQVNFENGVLLSAPIILPSINEQTAIAEVLSDLDADLAALEAQAAKARAVKQGMMQELLTGRVRLV